MHARHSRHYSCIIDKDKYSSRKCQHVYKWRDSCRPSERKAVPVYLHENINGLKLIRKGSKREAIVSEVVEKKIKLCPPDLYKSLMEGKKDLKEVEKYMRCDFFVLLEGQRFFHGLVLTFHILLAWRQFTSVDILEITVWIIDDWQ